MKKAVNLGIITAKQKRRRSWPLQFVQVGVAIVSTALAWALLRLQFAVVWVIIIGIFCKRKIPATKNESNTNPNCIWWYDN